VKQKLTKTDRQELQQLHKITGDKRNCGRIKAVLAFDDGCSFDEVEKILLLSEETIQHHITEYWSNKKLQPENGGRDSQLCEADAEGLIYPTEMKVRHFRWV
jgi:hypothetical protein